ncbi:MULTISPECIES: hypothetical protein [Aerococcus]|nr:MULTISPECIES: hypothetical protein [Aerococcus]KAA9293737.1 hypothetical protein F6I06_00995 [Aerococcus mictus]KAA9299822.1 hypothetical protein F6I08_00170 [Aerococcus tenax]MCY3027119.1 hypothetical protein [Aerococcus loyolae]MCY3066411.1 hypothetical protein [Aerococcus mictus]MCY3075815.1 hypothetical protein [Aerococcus mictus]
MTDLTKNTEGMNQREKAAARREAMLNYFGSHSTVTFQEVADKFGYPSAEVARPKMYRLKSQGYIDFTVKDSAMHGLEVLKRADEPIWIKSQEQSAEYWELYYLLKELAMTENDTTVLNAKTNTIQVAMKALSKV